MISTFARAGVVLADSRYSERAERAANLVLAKPRPNGRLRRSFKDGQAQHSGYLDDYAFVIAALLDLYEAAGEVRGPDQAVGLGVTVEQHYEDKQAGGFFGTSDDHEELLAREKPNYDGAEPSGNSVQILNLLGLHERTTNDRYRSSGQNGRCAPSLAFSHARLLHSPRCCWRLTTSWTHPKRL